VEAAKRKIASAPPQHPRLSGRQRRVYVSASTPSTHLDACRTCERYSAPRRRAVPSAMPISGLRKIHRTGNEDQPRNDDTKRGGSCVASLRARGRAAENSQHQHVPGPENPRVHAQAPSVARLRVLQSSFSRSSKHSRYKRIRAPPARSAKAVALLLHALEVGLLACFLDVVVPR